MRRSGRKRGAGPAEGWPPESDATIDRLAFLAASPYLLARAHPWWMRVLERAEGGPGRRSRWSLKGTPDEQLLRVKTPEIAGARLADYSFACQFVVGVLSVEERRDLRQSGTLPVWFFNELEREANARRRRQRALRD